MKWLKLDTGIASDAKVMNLVARHGCEGLGLYVLTLALIGQGVDADHQECLLEHTPETLRTFSGLTPERVHEILTTMVSLKLIDHDPEKNQYSNVRLLRRLDDWTSKRIHRSNSGVTPEKLRLKRKEEKRKEKNMATPELLLSRLSKKFSPPPEDKPKVFVLEEEFPDRPPMVYDLYRWMSGMLYPKAVQNPEEEIEIAQWLSNTYGQPLLREFMNQISRGEDSVKSLSDFAAYIDEHHGEIKQGEVL